MGTGLWFVSWAIAERTRETEWECFLDRRAVCNTNTSIWHVHGRKKKKEKKNWNVFLDAFPLLPLFLLVWFQRNWLQYQHSWLITRLSFYVNSVTTFCFDLPFSLNTVMNVSPQEAHRTLTVLCSTPLAKAMYVLCSTALFTAVSPLHSCCLFWWFWEKLRGIPIIPPTLCFL